MISIEEKILEIKRIAKEKKLSKYSIHKATSLTQPTIKSLIEDESPNSNESTVNIVYDYLTKEYGSDTSNSIVAVPEAEYYTSKTGNKFFELDNGQYIMKVPLLDIGLQAGFSGKYADTDYNDEVQSFHSIVVNKIHLGKYLAFRVFEFSMDSGNSDAILPKDIVTGRELNREHWRNKLYLKNNPYWIIATTENKYPIIKEIVEHDVERAVIKCHSLNPSPEYQDFDLSLNKVTALFNVVDISRNTF